MIVTSYGDGVWGSKDGCYYLLDKIIGGEL